jgi:extracellular factor (EF) 3-hydroxypalmitic acid methyl ester biosynthesis protein
MDDDTLEKSLTASSVSRSNLQYLTANDWTLIRTKAKRVTFHLGEEIIREGAQLSGIYVIRRGSASVELATGKSVALLAMLEEGDVCGEMAFLEQRLASASVIAKDLEVEADSIDARDIRALFDSFPGLAARFFQSLAVILSQRLRSTSAELIRATGPRFAR